MYVWIEAVSGYYSASKLWAKENIKSDEEFWSEQTRSYYVHGKDNIPFHSLIWPAILMGTESKSLPTHIISNEYLTLEKRKLSTSQNWAVWVPYVLDRYHPDSLRYFLTINAPENRDTDFSWREFIYSHNSELLGAYGNFVNRTLKFIEKSFEGMLPDNKINLEIIEATNSLYNEVGRYIEEGHFKQALETLFGYIRKANKHFDDEKPWIQIKDDLDTCRETLATCVYIIGNASQLLSPFLPFSSEEVRSMLNIHKFEWTPITKFEGKLQHVEPLFERIDVKIIEEEVEYLINQSEAV